MSDRCLAASFDLRFASSVLAAQSGMCCLRDLGLANSSFDYLGLSYPLAYSHVEVVVLSLSLLIYHSPGT